MKMFVCAVGVMCRNSNKMLTPVSTRKFAILLYRSMSDHMSSFDASGGGECNSSPVDSSQKFDEELHTKLLKVAIIGVPNAGKSTLINQIIGRNVFGVSCKVHTTQCRARAAMIEDKTQIVFLDTPGLVSGSELNKYELDHSFIRDGEEAIKEADVFGVIHDISNRYTRHRLNPKVLRLLHLYQNKRSFLIINKVDTMKSKHTLLDSARLLTNGTLNNQLESDLSSVKWKTPDFSDSRITETELLKKINNEKGWSYFEEVFMVSALNGEGVGDIKMYLLDLAKPARWIFSRSNFTDQEPTKHIEHVVYCKLLDNLPNEMPYNIEVALEYYNVDQDDTVIAVVLVGCDKQRIEKFVMGRHGKRIKNVALAAEEELRKFFQSDVRLKLVVTDKIAEKRARLFGKVKYYKKAKSS